jgi:hypothetical protein
VLAATRMPEITMVRDERSVPGAPPCPIDLALEANLTAIPEDVRDALGWIRAAGPRVRRPGIG